jgi:hypothetical protein
MINVLQLIMQFYSRRTVFCYFTKYSSTDRVKKTNYVFLVCKIIKYSARVYDLKNWMSKTSKTLGRLQMTSHNSVHSFTISYTS